MAYWPLAEPTQDRTAMVRPPPTQRRWPAPCARRSERRRRLVDRGAASDDWLWSSAAWDHRVNAQFTRLFRGPRAGARRRRACLRLWHRSTYGVGGSSACGWCLARPAASGGGSSCGRLSRGGARRRLRPGHRRAAAGQPPCPAVLASTPFNVVAYSGVAGVMLLRRRRSRGCSAGVAGVRRIRLISFAQSPSVSVAASGSGDCILA